MCVSVSVCVSVCVYVCVSVSVCVYVSVCKCVQVCVSLGQCGQLCLRVYVVCVCVCVWMTLFVPWIVVTGPYLFLQCRVQANFCLVPVCDWGSESKRSGYQEPESI